jgi:hypothetical protein
MDIMCIALAEPPLVLCRGGDDNKSRICTLRTVEVEDIVEGVTKE